MDTQTHKHNTQITHTHTSHHISHIAHYTYTHHTTHLEALLQAADEGDVRLVADDEVLCAEVPVEHAPPEVQLRGGDVHHGLHHLRPERHPLRLLPLRGGREGQPGAPGIAQTRTR